MGNKSSSSSKSTKPLGFKPRTPKGGSKQRNRKASGKGKGFSSVDRAEINITFTTSDEDESSSLQKRLVEIEENYGEEVGEAVEEMVRCFEGVKVEVALRFAATSPRTAVEDYTRHLTWREGQPLMTDHSTMFYPISPPDFPRKWMERGGLAKDGSHIIFCQGAMYDKAICGVEKYVERTTNVVDSIFPVDSDSGLVSVFIDCRPYKGMKNPPAQQLLGFFRAVQEVCSANFPGRISKVVIYPIPSFLVGLINVIKRMFSKDVREKLIFLGGSGSIGSKCPKKLWEYVEDASGFPEAAHVNHAKE